MRRTKELSRITMDLVAAGPMLFIFFSLTDISDFTGFCCNN